MKNTTLGIIMILFAIGVGFFIFSNGSATATGKVILDTGSGNAQIVNLHVEGGKYVLSPDTVKKGIPVRIEADISRMPGCSKGIVISALNIRKSFSSSDNVLEFTPDKAGTFNIACSMNMYKGTLKVLESDGTKSTYAEKQSASGGSCGAGGGGCGCGGG